MILVVSGVSTLIHLYSVAYLDSDRGYARYFSYLNFFVFSMLLLVLAGNFVLLIVGWAFVGFASYALISFWYRRNTATKAGMKAFVINVIGDVGLVFAAFFIFRELGTFDYLPVFHAAPQHFSTNQGVLIAICLLLLVGAFAKSAQLPLHTWLPDAMEGPTPVSALIHAATMVTAGVYLIARTTRSSSSPRPPPTSPPSSASRPCSSPPPCALAVTDLKRIIAYSTISQIGYMVVGVSIGAYAAGLLPPDVARLLQGAPVHGGRLGDLGDGRDPGHRPDGRAAMGDAVHLDADDHRGAGARRLPRAPRGSSPRTRSSSSRPHRGGFYWIFTIGGYVGALLTAFYAFRIIFRVFWGEPVSEARELEQGHLAHAEPENPLSGEKEDTDVGFPGPEHHIAERDWPMRSAMAVLASSSIFGGALQIPGLDRRDRDVPAGTFLDSTLLRAVRPRSPPTGRGWRSAARRDRRNRRRLPGLRRPARHLGRADRRFRPIHTLPVQQVVLRRALQRGRLPPR